MDELLENLKNCLLRQKQEKSDSLITQVQQSPAEKQDKSRQPGFTAVGIAASTGGPSTLMQLFSGLKATQKAAYFIVLHGPAWMLKSFSSRLQGLTSMKVFLADNGMKIKPGHVYIAPGDVHSSINSRTFEMELLDTPPENYVRPSADPLFRSIAAAFGGNAIGVVLTGMGHDGSIGSGYIAAAGGIVIAQDPSTAILPSMPQSVIDLRIAKVVTPLEQMGSVILQTIEKINSI
jgi:two-component system chemotaxis response regulator CheB